MKAPWMRRESADGTKDDLVTRALLISIRPRFANAILDGSKTIELRRTMPTLPPAALAIIYSSSPTKALVGWATVEEIVQATPHILWQMHQHSTGVTSDEFMKYFAGRSDGYGLQLTAVRRAENEVSLAALRTHGLEPPQSWRYIAPDIAQALRRQMSDATAAHSRLPFRHSDLTAVAG